MTDDDRVMIDAVLEIGGTVAEHGPGIVKRWGRETSLGLPRFNMLTLRGGWEDSVTPITTQKHLEIRGTYPIDYGASSNLDGQMVNPYSFEEVTE
jgi:hypothetical protein